MERILRARFDLRVVPTFGKAVSAAFGAGLGPTGSKITALVLDWGVEDSAARSDSRVFGVG